VKWVADLPEQGHQDTVTELAEEFCRTFRPIEAPVAGWRSNVSVNSAWV
jgi:hypothetical protein